MTKIVLWVVVIVVVLFALRLLNIAKAKRRAADSQRSPSQGRKAEAMVRCAFCGVYLPQADAVTGPNGLTCGDARCAQK